MLSWGIQYVLRKKLQAAGNEFRQFIIYFLLYLLNSDLATLS